MACYLEIENSKLVGRPFSQIICLFTSLVCASLLQFDCKVNHKNPKRKVIPVNALTELPHKYVSQFKLSYLQIKII